MSTKVAVEDPSTGQLRNVFEGIAQAAHAAQATAQLSQGIVDSKVFEGLSVGALIGIEALSWLEYRESFEDSNKARAKTLLKFWSWKAADLALAAARNPK